MDNIVLASFDLNKFKEDLAVMVAQTVKAVKTEELQDKLLAPAEAVKLFQPAITKVTLTAWTNQGLLQDYRFGGRVYYKYSEIMEAGKSLKRYKKK